MKISVITVCYNAADNIEKTILSVLNQTYSDIEYIIVDGNSYDGTFDIISKYNKQSLIIHEADYGIYDAMNKGIRYSTGDYIYFLNSGDVFSDDDTVAEVVKWINILKPDLICANVRYIYRGEKKTLHNYFKKRILNKFFLAVGITVCHQGIIAKSSIMKQKMFNTNYEIWADQEFIAYCLNQKYYIRYVNMTLCNFDAYGFSAGEDKKSISRKECDAINSIYNRFWYFIFRIPKKIVRTLC